MMLKLVASVSSIAILIASVTQGYGKKLPSGGRILDPGDDSTIVDPPHSQPWAVLVNVGLSECSGTLISKRHVITSAHCGTAVYVVVGEHNRDENDGEEEIKVIKNIPYPGFKDNDSDDLMIVELEKEVNNKFAKPALLPKENERFDKYIVSGFGITAPGVDSDYLRTVNLSDYGTHESCYKLGSMTFEPDKHICGESQVDISFGPAEGDSGGPWVVKNENGDAILVGVHMDGTTHDHAIPHVAVRVSYPRFLRWIKKVTGL